MTTTAARTAPGLRPETTPGIITATTPARARVRTEDRVDLDARTTNTLTRARNLPVTR